MVVTGDSGGALNADNCSQELTWNEILYDDGLAARVTRSSFRWLTIALCTIGIIGNVLAVYTLVRRRMRTLSTYTYLTALCLSNIVAQISIIMFEVEIFVAPYRYNCLMASTAKALASSTFALSTWITVGFTLDRYVMICFPFAGKHLCTRRNAIYVIVLCLLLAIGYLIPQLLAQECHPLMQHLPCPDHDQPTAPVYWVTGLSTFGESPVFRLGVTFFCNCILIRVVPFLVIFILNFRLVKTLAETKRRHREMNPFERNSTEVTHMLVVVISAYLLCVIPSIPFAAFFAYDPLQYINVSLHYRIFQHMDEFTKFLIVLNSASQCYLYIFFGRRFRRELSSFLCLFCIKYCRMPIPQSYLNDEREPFSPDAWNPSEDFEIVLEGGWLTNKRQYRLTGIEFNFHYVRRPSRLTMSNSLPLTKKPHASHHRLSVGLLNHFRKSS